MPDVKQGYVVALQPAELADGRLCLAFIAKRTFKIGLDGRTEEALPDDEQPELTPAPVYEGDKTGMDVPPLEEGDMAPEKPRVDIIVKGKAIAPGGKPVQRFEASVQIGRTLRRVAIIGPRQARWMPPRKQEGKLVPQPPVFTDPKPVVEVPLTYALAYGGKTRIVPDEAVRRVAAEVDKAIAEETKEEREAAQNKAEEKQKKSAEEAKQAAAQSEKKRTDDKLAEVFGKPGKGDPAAAHAYRDDSTRVEGVAVPTTGATQVLDLEQFKDEIAREQAEAEVAAAEARARVESDRKAREHHDGDVVEVIKDGTQVMTAAEYERAVLEAQAEQEADAEALHKAAAERATAERRRRDGGVRLEHEDDLAEVDGDDWVERAKQKQLAEPQKKKADGPDPLAEFPLVPAVCNPVGAGFVCSNVKEVLDGLRLPMIEDPDRPLTPETLLQDPGKPNKLPLPFGFGWYDRAWQPRARFAGLTPSQLGLAKGAIEDYRKSLDMDDDEQVQQEAALRDSKLPLLDARFWNAAHPLMQWNELKGDEEITLKNLDKKGTLFFRLPGKVPLAELSRGRGIERKPLRLDTLVIDTEAQTVTCTWRAQYPLGSWDELVTYPPLVSSVLDLSVADKRAQDVEEQAKKVRDGSTAMLDLEEFVSDSTPYLPERAPDSDAGGHTQALDLELMGRYIEHDGSYSQEGQGDWVEQAKASVKDERADKAADRKAKEREEKYKLAMARIAGHREAEVKRREEIGKALAEGKPVPPKLGADGKPMPMRGPKKK